MKTFNYNLVITGCVPSKKNCNKFNSRTKQVYKSSRFRLWFDEAKRQIAIWKRCLGADEPILKNKIVKVGYIVTTFYNSDERRHDLDNQMTTIFDLLKDCGLIDDDCTKVIADGEYHYKRCETGDEGCVIELKDCIFCNVKIDAIKGCKV